MSILIAYDSLHGPAKKCISVLKSEFNRKIDIIKLSTKNPVPDWKKYHIVIIGSCVSNDKIQNTVQNFCQTYENELLKKEIGIFISCLTDSRKAADIMESGLPKSLTSHAKTKGCFGGLMHVRQHSVVKRFFRHYILGKNEDDFLTLFHNSVTGFTVAFDPLPKQTPLLNFNFFSARES